VLAQGEQLFRQPGRASAVTAESATAAKKATKVAICFMISLSN